MQNTSCSWNDGSGDLQNYLLQYFGVEKLADINPYKDALRVVDCRKLIFLNCTIRFEGSLQEFSEGLKSTQKKLGEVIGEEQHRRFYPSRPKIKAAPSLQIAATDYDISRVTIHSARIGSCSNSFMIPLGLRFNFMPRQVQENPLMKDYGGFQYIVPAHSRSDERVSILRPENSANIQNTHSTRLINIIGTTEAEKMRNGIIFLPERKGQKWCLVPRRHALEVTINSHPDVIYIHLYMDAEMETCKRPHFYLIPSQVVEELIKEAGENLHNQRELRDIRNTGIEIATFDQDGNWCNESIIGNSLKELKLPTDNISSWLTKQGCLEVELQLQYSIFPKAIMNWNVICTYEPNGGRIELGEVDNHTVSENFKSWVQQSRWGLLGRLTEESNKRQRAEDVSPMEVSES